MNKNKNIYFLLFALLTVSFFILAGISVAERNGLGFVVSILASIITMGIGFRFKRKWRKESE